MGTVLGVSALVLLTHIGAFVAGGLFGAAVWVWIKRKVDG